MEIPPQWASLLRGIRRVVPSAVLAGGALRDLDNDRPVKDLDIFVIAENDRDAEGVTNLLREAGYPVCNDPGDITAYPEDQNLEVVRVAHLEGREDVQFIFVNWDTSRIVERFDYGICQITFDGTALYRSPAYEEDKRDQVFRLRRDRPTPVSMRGSVKRYARLTNEKYPGWDWQPYEAPDPFPTLACN